MSALYTAAAAAVVGAGVGVYGASQAGKAANAQSRSQDAAIAEQQRQYDQNRTDQMPWHDAGVSALNRLNQASTGNISSFKVSPDYNFRRTEGDRGIQQTAAARGGLYSGNALKALSEYNSNLAAGEYGNWWNRQAGLAGVGQQATNQIGAYGQNTANNISNSLTAQGDARASGIIGGANSLAGGINNGLQTGLGIYNAYQSWGNNYLQPIQTTAKYM